MHVMISANVCNLFFTYKECPHGWQEFIGTASCYRFYRFPKENYDMVLLHAVRLVDRF